MPTTTSEASGLVLHHLENSRSQRILWLLEELGVPYTIKRYKRLPTFLAPPEMLAVHPLGKSPIITDGNVTLAESGAIVEYLLEKYANGRFKSPEESKTKNLYYTHFGEGTLMPYLSNWLLFSMVSERTPWLLRFIISPVMEKVKAAVVKNNVRRAAEMIEKDLGESSTGWFAGGAQPTSADFMMLFPLETLPRVMGDEIGPNIKRWVEQAHSRPAYRAALEKGGPYAYVKL